MTLWVTFCCRQLCEANLNFLYRFLDKNCWSCSLYYWISAPECLSLFSTNACRSACFVLHYLRKVVVGLLSCLSIIIQCTTLRQRPLNFWSHIFVPSVTRDKRHFLLVLRLLKFVNDWWRDAGTEKWTGRMRPRTRRMVAYETYGQVIGMASLFLRNIVCVDFGLRAFVSISSELTVYHAQLARIGRNTSRSRSVLPSWSVCVICPLPLSKTKLTKPI